MDIDECASSPCHNNGVCQEREHSGESGDGGGYDCLCVDGFEGVLCEVNVDDCADEPCKEYEKCTDGVNSYRLVPPCRFLLVTGKV